MVPWVGPGLQVDRSIRQIPLGDQCGPVVLPGRLGAMNRGHFVEGLRPLLADDCI